MKRKTWPKLSAALTLLISISPLTATAVLANTDAQHQEKAPSPFEDEKLRNKLTAAITSAHSFPHRFSAEVWLLDMSERLKRWIPEPAKRIELLKLIHEEADFAGLQPNLVLAVIEVESGFKAMAVSSAGARGLMQIMPFWLEVLDEPGSDLFDPRTNLRFGCTILRHYIDRERKQPDGNIGLNRGLARYNGSLGRDFYWRRVRRAWERHWYKQ